MDLLIKWSSRGNRVSRNASDSLFQKRAWFFLFNIIVIVVVVFNGCLKKNTEELPVLGNVPDFRLTEHSGKSFSRAELDGKIWIADFIFTNCGGTCPIMTSAMGEIQTKLVEEKMDDVKLVSISVDPERDTPDVLSTFANGYGADPARWYFLTGEGEAIQKLSKEGFHLAAATGMSADEQIIHSNRFVLVDRQANIRGYYDGTDEEAVKKLLTDLKNLYQSQNPS